MTKEQIATSSPLALFRHVFGLQEGQTLTQFMAECGPLREDTVFVGEVRAYATANV